MPTRPNKAGSGYKPKPERTYPEHAGPAKKKTDRRAGDKSTRARSPQKQRQSPKTGEHKRGSGFELDKPVRSKQLARERKKGQNPPRRKASR